MLSRIAESFFWIGRYVERAEATTRLLAEHHQLMVQERQVPDATACRVLLDAMAIPAPVRPGPSPLVGAVLGDGTEPSTITGAVASARENARAIRDAVSTELYEALNATYLAVVRGAGRPSSPGVALHRLLERLLVVQGVVDWTMPRDEGFVFHSLGRALERIDMTARLLHVRHELLWPDSGPVVTLRSAGGLSAFLRSRAPMTADAVRAFLVLDPQFPRSMRQSAAQAEDAVRALGRFGTREGGDLLQAVGMAHSRLEFAWDTAPGEVDRLVDVAQHAAAHATGATAAGFFRQPSTTVWSH